MKKHAYLIMSHGNFKILTILLKLLDYEHNDIFIHIDKKIKHFDFEGLRKICKKSSVFFTPKRYNVKWGMFSQVKNELQLYKTAMKNGKYKYFHLISGVDLPLKSQKEIHDFFSNSNKNYIFFTEKPSFYDYARLSRYHFPNNLSPKIITFLNILQDKFKLDRFKKYNFTFQKGSNWCSLTYDAVLYLLNNKNLIYKMCKFSSCADECYKQIILLNSNLRNTIFINQLGKPDDLREIDWLNGNGKSPHIYTLSNFEKLKNSNKLFARKFDESVDTNIVNLIETYIIHRTNESEKLCNNSGKKS